MRILWVSHFLPYPDVGYGALQRSRNLLLALCRNHEVHLISYYRDPDTRCIADMSDALTDLEQRCKTVEMIPHHFGRWKKVEAACRGIITQRPVSVHLYRSQYLMGRVLYALKRYNIDLVHADTMGLSDEIVDVHPDIVRVLNHHNIESHMMARRSDREQHCAKKWLFTVEAKKLRKYQNEVCPRYDMNLVVSNLDRERLNRECHKAKAVVIENGVDCNYFQYVSRNGAGQRIVFTGALDWYPNADAMGYFCQEIWPELKARHPRLSMDVIGKGPGHDLRQVIGTQKDIYLHGYVSDVRPYVRGARVFVCPMRDGGGTKLKLLDALAQGIPIVATDVACEGLGLRDKEHVLIANTQEEFRRKIERLLSDDWLCEYLSVNGRNYVESSYSSDAIGRKLAMLYEQMVDQKKERGVSPG